MDLWRYYYTLYLVFVLPLAAVAFHTGAPETVCGTMTPGHPFPPQEGKSPYRVIVRNMNVPVGKPVDILLSAPTSGPPFVGFLIEIYARHGDQAMGQFKSDSDESAYSIKCERGVPNPGMVMTHKNRHPKTQVNLQWTAPGEGEYVPIVTWVKQMDTFWVKEAADTVIMVVSSHDAQSSPGNVAKGISSPREANIYTASKNDSFDETHSMSPGNPSCSILETTSFQFHHIIDSDKISYNNKKIMGYSDLISQ